MSHEIETINKETEIISISNRNSEVENYNNENGGKKKISKGLPQRPEQAEERILELEDRSIEIGQSKEQKKRMKKK